MSEPLPVVLVPGLLASARLYADQIPILWKYGPVLVADHTRDDSMAAIARRILDSAPPAFALLGLSMGGYISLEIMRQAPGRVRKLALLDTSARPDQPDQSERRRAQIALARAGKLREVADQQFPLLVDTSRLDDSRLKELVRIMADETGPEALVRQQTANIGRIDSNPSLAAIACPTLVLVGEGDQLIPVEHSQELAKGIAGARLVVTPHSGHLSTLEQPEAVNRELEAWMSG
jgi:pimeloyl-ACP methyl ester carboxylesterase